MHLISNMLSLFKWLFVRLPLGFSVPFTAASLWWVLSGFKRLDDAVVNLATTVVADRLQSEFPGHIAQALIANQLDAGPVMQPATFPALFRGNA